MNKLVFSSVAEADMDEIWLHIARDSSARADRVVTVIHDACIMLADDPRIGRPRDEFLSGLRSWPVYSFLVFYEPMEDGILVHRIVHGSRDLPQIFA